MTASSTTNGATPGVKTNAPQSSQNTMETSSEPYIFTTIRFQQDLLRSPANRKACCDTISSLYLLAFHAQRFTDALCEAPSWNPLWNALRAENTLPEIAISLLSADCYKAIEEYTEIRPQARHEALRLRVTISTRGKVSCEVSAPLSSLSERSLFPITLTVDDTNYAIWTASLDTEATPVTVATMYKTSDRACYDRARRTAGISPSDTREVLLYTNTGQILDGSITTPYFLRSGRWITPAASCGGLRGTTRRYALENKLCEEGIISIHSLTDGEIIWLSNAVRGFFTARFRKLLD